MAPEHGTTHRLHPASLPLELVRRIGRFGFLALVALLVVYQSVAIAGGDQFITLERRWFGKPMADGPMYKGLGNSWPVNSVRWIGRRIQMVEEIAAELDAANDNYPSTSNPATLSRSHA